MNTKIKQIAKVATGIVTLLTMSQGFAGPLSITDIEGGWQNPVTSNGGTTTIANVAGQGTDVISWGVPATPAGQSSYDFTPGTPSNPIAFNSPFLLGTFVHNNFPVFEPWLETVDYALSFSTNGAPSLLNTLITFTHNETPNVEPCDPSGATICPDEVTVSTPNLFSEIVVGDPADAHFFSILGWSTDGGNTFSGLTFVTEEGQANTAGLYAQITESVPEPGILSLLGLGLLGLGATRRRQSAKRS